MDEKDKPTPNLKLRRERDRRCWSQQEVADKIGTTSLNVGRWERGVTQPGPYFRQKLCEVFEKSSYELGLASVSVNNVLSLEQGVAIAPISVSSSTQTGSVLLWNVPYRRNLFFTGREDILTHVHEALHEQTSPVALAQPQAISGLGGIGKTQTAIEYAYRYRSDYSAILWVRAESPDLLVSDYLTLAALLNLPERNEQDQGLVAKAVIRWFDTHDSWLLILDNADELDAVSEYIPSSGKGHVLITTRAQAVGTTAQRVDLDKLSLDDGVTLLLRRIKRLRGNTASSVPSVLHSQAQAIVEAVDGLPLALDQAGAYIEETGCNLSDYLKFYKTKRTRLLRMRGKDATGHPEPVATTWSLSFEKIEHAHPAAADLLRLCAFLHPDAIPESILIEGASELGPALQLVAEDEFDLNEAIGELLRYSLIKRDVETRTLNIHRLVQIVIKDGMGEDDKREWEKRVVAMINRAFPEVEFEQWSKCQQILPHALLCAEHIVQKNVTNINAAFLLEKTGDYLFAREKYTQSEQLLRHSLEQLQSLLGRKAVPIANCIHLLAEVCHEQGNQEEAEKLAQEALAIYEYQFGSMHLKVANALNLLGEIYWQWTKYSQGEDVVLRSLQIRQQMLETDHTDIANSLNTLGLIYLYQSKSKEAEPLFAQAAAIWEQKNGRLHPRTISGLTNLGVTYSRLGKYTQAEQILIEAFKQREQVEQLIGQRDFDMGHSLFNLGLLYGETGKFALSEMFHQQALQRWEQSLGTNHPRLASILFSLGGVYRGQGKFEEAISLFERALSIRKWMPGVEIVDNEIANCLYSLAEVARSQGKFEEALSLHHQALTIREHMAGSENLYVAQSLNGLACLSYDSHEYEKAETLFERALSIRESKLGETHPSVAYTLGGIALLYVAQQKYSQAESLFQRALAIQEQSLEPTHPLHIEILKNHAKLLHTLQRDTEAEALEMRIQSLYDHQPS